eukprot:9711513-Karenia_brevis.AAC.1
MVWALCWICGAVHGLTGSMQFPTFIVYYDSENAGRAAHDLWNCPSSPILASIAEGLALAMRTL